MLRTLLSVVTVVLLAAIAFLLYANYAAPSRKADAGQDLTGAGAPPRPAAPAPPPKATPAPPVAPVVEAPPPPPKVVREAPKGRLTHIVQPGDSLSSISKTYFGTSEFYPKIAELNGLRGKDAIRVGQVLYLPDLPRVPVVEKPKNADEHQAVSSEPETADFEPMPTTLSAPVSRKEAKTQRTENK